MACLVNPTIINRHYVKIADENNEPVENYSNRIDYYVNVPCRRCVNCVRSYMTYWRNRLLYEFEYMSSDARRNSYFFTLTFDTKYYRQIDFRSMDSTRSSIHSFKRKFIDRIRKSSGSAPRHWIVTEYGERKGRLHLHGFFFDVNFDIHNLDRFWKYGLVDYSQMNENTIKYCTAYITKGNEDIILPPNKVQFVFCSPGIGKSYCDDPYNIRYHHPFPGVLNPVLQNSSQYLQSLPRYFKSKIFTDDEREDMTQQFFLENSDDVIPDPPYKIGKTIYTDYTLYMEACKKHVSTYKKLYKPLKKSYYGK